MFFFCLGLRGFLNGYIWGFAIKKIQCEQITNLPQPLIDKLFLFSLATNKCMYIYAYGLTTIDRSQRLNNKCFHVHDTLWYTCAHTPYTLKLYLQWCYIMARCTLWRGSLYKYRIIIKYKVLMWRMFNNFSRIFKPL